MNFRELIPSQALNKRQLRKAQIKDRNKGFQSARMLASSFSCCNYLQHTQSHTIVKIKINPAKNPIAAAANCLCARESRRCPDGGVSEGWVPGAGAGAGAGVGAPLVWEGRSAASTTRTAMRWPASQRAGAPLMK